jgi:hypothetical protein
VFLHELGKDLVLALQLGFELYDLLVFEILVDLGTASVIEGQVRVLEEQTLPGVEDRWIDPELIAQAGDRGALEKMALENGDLLRDGKVLTRLLGHW